MCVQPYRGKGGMIKMDTNVSISDLIQYFDEKLRKIDCRRIGDNIGKEPQFPMLIMFMGENAIEVFSEVYTRLVQFWPQYQNELIFLGIGIIQMRSNVSIYPRTTLKWFEKK